VLDPFGGSNTTGFAAESLGRRWITIELREPYLKGSMLRFPNGVVLADGRRVVIASAGLRPVLESDHQPSLFEFVSAD
jgi:DNA modification methylase